MRLALAALVLLLLAGCASADFPCPGTGGSPAVMLWSDGTARDFTVEVPALGFVAHEQVPANDYRIVEIVQGRLGEHEVVVRTGGLEAREVLAMECPAPGLSFRVMDGRIHTTRIAR